jgi:molybdopterin synthase catalytic subunit
MDELKRTVPIWKQEHFAEGGAAWVEGTPLG